MPDEDKLDNKPKVYVVDSSSIIDEPECIRELGKGGNLVVISEVVLEELDGHSKSDRGDTWRAARRAIRLLDDLRVKDKIHHSTKAAIESREPSFDNGGIVCWYPCLDGEAYEFNPLQPSKGDNTILKHAKRIRERDARGLEVILVTEDRLFSLKADSKEFPVQNLRLGKRNISRLEDIYKGYDEFKISRELFEKFLQSKPGLEKSISLADLQAELKDRELKLIWNQGVVLVDKSDNSKRLLTRYNHDEKSLRLLQYALAYDTKPTDEYERIRTKNFFGLQPAHHLQTLYIDYLLDDNIKLLVANGGYGTGKTTWLVFSALMNTLKIDKFRDKNKGKIKSINELVTDKYSEGIKLFRPEYLSSDYDPGTMPGTLEKKIASFFRPYEQAVKEFFRRAGCPEIADALLKDSTGFIERQATSFLQGINIFNAIACVDEAQNGTKNLTEIFLSRLDKGTKAVIVGDANQINNRYVRINNNMLTITAEIIREHPRPDAAVITLTYNCRQDVSNYARFVRGF